MKGTIDFKYDKANDVVVATPNWNVETKEDCEIWYKQWVDSLADYKRKVDCVMVLDNFNVDVKIAAVWGEYRAKILNTYTRFTYRINPNLVTGIFIKTSGVRFNASSKEADSMEGALHAIREDRKNAGVS
jgi:hypothetical protein